MDKWFKAMNKRQHTLLPMWPGFTILGGLFYKELLIPNSLTIYENGLADYYTGGEDSFKASSELLKLTKNDNNFWEKYDSKVYKLGNKYLTELYQFKVEKDYSTFSNEKIINTVNKIIEMLEFQGGTLTLARILPLKELDGFLRDNLSSDQEVQKAHGIFRYPIRPSWPEIEITEFLKLVKNFETGKISSSSEDEILKNHIEKFGWITTDLHYNTPLSLDELKIRLENELENGPKERLSEIKSRRIENQKQKQKLISELNPSDYMLGIIGLLSFEIWLKTYRRYFTTQVVYYSKDLFYEIAKRAGIDSEMIWWCTPLEIINFLHDNDAFPVDEINQRMKKMIMLTKNNRNIFYYGYEAEKIIDEEIPQEAIEYTKIMEGIPVSEGLARGNARVIIDHSSVDNLVKEGDIIVATQAPPSFIRAIQKSNGIVVEEGAITSHASILAREFHKPCIVGIKNATLLIKTGDELNINTDNGIVEIL